MRAGGATESYLDAVKDAVGVYPMDVPILAQGLTVYRWIGTGAVQTAGEGRFSVRVAFA